VSSRRHGQVGLLVVRAWVESDDGGGLRARITQVLDLESGDESVTVVASVDEVVAAVRAWLEAFLALVTSGSGDDAVTER
jgi:hypothetical protein